MLDKNIYSKENDAVVKKQSSEGKVLGFDDPLLRNKHTGQKEPVAESNLTDVRAAIFTGGPEKAEAVEKVMLTDEQKIADPENSYHYATMAKKGIREADAKLKEIKKEFSTEDLEPGMDSESSIRMIKSMEAEEKAPVLSKKAKFINMINNLLNLN